MLKDFSENYENIELKGLFEYTSASYGKYAVSVIMDRALPHISDGLKPVHRRILYAMGQLGLDSSSKHKKSARTVGDVLGKYHPHGDSSCYEAMVLMAQGFNTNHTLVDGQGNWGSQDDPSSFAAMRYTESRLTPYSEVFFSELGDGVVDFIPNFDGTLTEPKNLPARLPNVLINGSSGVAVAIATDIPPHNINEVVNATLELLDNPRATLDDILVHIKGPDMPCLCDIITTKEKLRGMYLSGKGLYKTRAIWHSEGDDIIITAVPVKTSPSKILESINDLVESKSISTIESLDDQSDSENPVCLVIKCLKNTNHQGVMDFLFKRTNLETTNKCNMNLIGLDNKASQKGLVETLNEWILFRTETVKRKYENKLKKVLADLHILDGLLLAYLNIDEVINIIRTSDSPKEDMMSKIGLTEIQADYVLNTRLKSLAKLEEMSINDKKKKLEGDRDAFEKILSTEKNIKKEVKKNLLEDVKKYGKNRLCDIYLVDESEMSVSGDVANSTIIEEPATVIVSERGLIRSSKNQMDGRGLSYKEGDKFKDQCSGFNIKPVCIMDNAGRLFNILPLELPNAKGYGDPIAKYVSLSSTFNSITHIEENSTYFVGTNAGYGYKIDSESMLTKQKRGKTLLSVPEGFEPLKPIKLKEKDLLFIILENGEAKAIDTDTLPILPKGKGVKITSGISPDNKIVFVCKVVDETKVNIFDENGVLQKTLGSSDIKKLIMENGKKGKNIMPSKKMRVSSVTMEC